MCIASLDEATMPLPVCLGEHQPRGGDIKDLDASCRKEGKEVDDVEAFDKSVGQLNESAGQQDFSG